MSVGSAMDALLVSSEFPPGPGGIGTHAWHVARQLQARGWEVRVLTPQDYVPVEEAERFNAEQPFGVVRAPSGKGALRNGVQRLRALRRLTQGRRPDVLVASGDRAVWLAALGRPAGVPFVAFGHGTEFGSPRGWGARVSRWSFGRADLLVCVSEFTRDLVLAAGVRSRCIKVVPNGADDARFRVLPEPDAERCRRRWGLHGRRVLLTVGQVSERKGQDTVIRAMPEVLKSVPEALYLIVGLPSRESEYARLARELGVDEHVRFLGRREPDEVVELLNVADLFVMTSRTTPSGDCEGFGIAAVEAALCGKPAIVSEGSGLVEAIEHGRTGLAVPPDDAAATASAIVRLLTDAPMRERMGVAALERAQSEQTWAHRGEQYDHLLREVVAHKRR
ncbi:MAG TPA: glycosyltransferase family 4 protein [Chthonomonadales bacterium]|nr:glycosyltransferase family 4 protein [Chthonomonadales bacterium]